MTFNLNAKNYDEISENIVGSKIFTSGFLYKKNYKIRICLRHLKWHSIYYLNRVHLYFIRNSLITKQNVKR